MCPCEIASFSPANNLRAASVNATLRFRLGCTVRRKSYLYFRPAVPAPLPSYGRTGWLSSVERGMQSMKGSDLLVAALENEGVEQIFGVPGEENLDVVESLRRSRIKLIVTRHEQAAAFMAATHGRLTGKPGVCLATLGPGALNLTTGAAFALLSALPIVMITGQKRILSHKQALFQVVDIVATMAPLTKMARQIVSAATIPSIVREAFRLAQQAPLGPVPLELPEVIPRKIAAILPVLSPS